MTAPRPIWEIAAEINKTWPKIYFGALPYLNAMRSIEAVTDYYCDDSGKDVVIYFLSNAATWRGEDARRIKAELKALLK